MLQLIFRFPLTNHLSVTDLVCTLWPFLQISNVGRSKRLSSPRSKKHGSSSSLRVRELPLNGVNVGGSGGGGVNGLLMQFSNGRPFVERRNTEQNFMKRSGSSNRSSRGSASPQIAMTPTKMIGRHKIATPSSVAEMAIANV